MLYEPLFGPHAMSTSQTTPLDDCSSEPAATPPLAMLAPMPASDGGDDTTRVDEKEGAGPDRECRTPKAEKCRIPPVAATCPRAPRKPRPAPKSRRGSWLTDGTQLISVGEQELRELFFPSHHHRDARVRTDPPPNGCWRKRRRWEFEGEEY